MNIELNTVEKQRLEQDILHGLEKYGRFSVSMGVAKMVFKYYPLEAKMIDGKFTIVEEVDELKNFCAANNLRYEIDHEHYELKLRKLK